MSLERIEKRDALAQSQPSVARAPISRADPESALSAATNAGQPGPFSALVDAEWQTLLDKDDRTSPAEYPDMCLITRTELAWAMTEAWFGRPLPEEPPPPTFQALLLPWMLDCFGQGILDDGIERNYRFLDEGLELVQATGLTRDEAHQLVDYVFNRDVGEPSQEVGGVMVCLAALCLCHGLDMHADGETELARILQPAIMDKIRAKQATKPRYSPLPGVGATS